MQSRSVLRTITGSDVKVGPLNVRQPLPYEQLKKIGPFLLLHHAGPREFPVNGTPERLNPHPHRGFEPVTFLFSGKLHHRDSAGHEGFLNAGDVQWMTAGKGIIHSEGPSAELTRDGGTLELVQLWVNLPRDHKLTEPAYQDIPTGQIPLIVEDGGNMHLKLVAGSYREHRGPARTFTDIFAAMIHFAAGTEVFLPVSPGHEALGYVLDGITEWNGTTVSSGQMAQLDRSGEGIRFTSRTAGKALLLSGTPIEEPVVSYGPFVMNYPGEIKQAILDYEQGKMGTLAY